MEDLDRVLDGDDVDLAVVVDVIDHPGERGRLTRAGRTGHQDEATRLECERSEHRREAEVLERDGADGNPPQDQAAGPARTERVDPEPAHTGRGVREVGLVGALELLDEVRTQDLADERLRVGRHEDRGLELAQAAVDADSRRRPDLAVQVGSATFEKCPKVRLDGLVATLCRHSLVIVRRGPNLEPLVDHRVDHREDVAFLHDVAFRHRDLGHLAGHF